MHIEQEIEVSSLPNIQEDRKAKLKPVVSGPENFEPTTGSRDVEDSVSGIGGPAIRYTTSGRSAIDQRPVDDLDQTVESRTGVSRYRRHRSIKDR